MTLLIQNARCWNGGGFHTADVLLQGGKIKSLGTSISSDGVNALFDARGQYFLIPGFVDVHVHLREPGFSYKETISSGTLAAAHRVRGGSCGGLYDRLRNAQSDPGAGYPGSFGRGTGDH